MRGSARLIIHHFDYLHTLKRVRFIWSIQPNFLSSFAASTSLSAVTMIELLTPPSLRQFLYVVERRHYKLGDNISGDVTVCLKNQ